MSPNGSRSWFPASRFRIRLFEDITIELQDVNGEPCPWWFKGHTFIRLLLIVHKRDIILIKELLAWNLRYRVAADHMAHRTRASDNEPSLKQCMNRAPIVVDNAPTLWPVQFAGVPLSLVIKPISVPPEMHPWECTRGSGGGSFRFEFLVAAPIPSLSHSSSDSQWSGCEPIPYPFPEFCHCHWYSKLNHQPIDQVWQHAQIETDWSHRYVRFTRTFASPCVQVCTR